MLFGTLHSRQIVFAKTARRISTRAQYLRWRPIEDNERICCMRDFRAAQCKQSSSICTLTAVGSGFDNAASDKFPASVIMAVEVHSRSLICLLHIIASSTCSNVSTQRTRYTNKSTNKSTIMPSVWKSEQECSFGTVRKNSKLGDGWSCLPCPWR